VRDSPLSGAVKALLNDRAVFPFLREQANGREVCLFDREGWRKLRELFQKEDFSAFKGTVEARLAEMRKLQRSDTQPQRTQGNQNRAPGRRDAYGSNLKLGTALADAPTRYPATLQRFLDVFEEFGCLDTHLPNMEDYGKVAEFSEPAVLEQYFLSKMARAKEREGRALKHVLEQTKVLLQQGADGAQVAFFLRKLDSLKSFPEVIIDGTGS